MKDRLLLRIRANQHKLSTVQFNHIYAYKKVDKTKDLMTSGEKNKNEGASKKIKKGRGKGGNCIKLG
mgnify:CR=1 FL=1